MTGDSREFSVLQAQRAMKAASLLRRLEEARSIVAAYPTEPPPPGVDETDTTDLFTAIMDEARDLGAVSPDPTAYLVDLVGKAIRDGVVDTHPTGQARGSY